MCGKYIYAKWVIAVISLFGLYKSSKKLWKYIFGGVLLTLILISAKGEIKNAEYNRHHENVTEQGVTATSSIHHQETQEIITKEVNKAKKEILEEIQKHTSSSDDKKQD